MGTYRVLDPNSLETSPLPSYNDKSNSQWIELKTKMKKCMLTIKQTGETGVRGLSWTQ